jgi:hypothetical protein
MSKDTTLMPAERCIHEIGRPGHYHACLKPATVVASFKSRVTGSWTTLHYCRLHEAYARKQHGDDSVQPYVRRRYLYGVGA